MAALAPDRPGLVCTSDVPLITPADVADFAAQAPAAAGITVGVVLKERLDAAHPGAPASTFVTLQETGPVATGCLFAVRTGAVLARPHLVRRAFAARKSQWQSVRLLGLRLSWDFVRRRLALAQIVARAEGLLGCKVEVVADVAPNLCYDIDNVDDYLYASAYSERTSHRAGE
jgi:hypothetical protein